jgi:4-hydroxy-tetrahydrodipicolinate reductase
MAIKIAINGANGRMGQEIAKIVEADESLKLIEKFTSSNTITSTNVSNVDVIIDFSSENGLLDALKHANCRIVSGTTGISPETFTKMRQYGEEKNGIIWGSNTSFGVNLLFAMVKKLGSLLGEEYDAEIFERHHRLKKDAPSGTAITIGKKIAEGRSSQYIQRNYSIQGERKLGEIGFGIERGGKTVGYHEASFISDDERIWIGHEAFDRSIFAKGAVKLARIAHAQEITGYNEACDILSNIL